MPWEEIEHTADAAFRVWADSLEELLVEAAKALFDLITDLDAVEPREEVRIEVTEAEDEVELLHDWLEEIHFQHEVNGLLFSEFEVDELERTDDGWRAAGTAKGEPYDPDRHPFHTEVKAITYHNMRVEREDGRWVAEYVVDL
ncbi:MAG: archease [Euryarchaeota archaeon]